MHDVLPAHLVDSFFSRVDKSCADGCWAWTGYTNNHGYGMYGWKAQAKGQHAYAHRVTYTLANGPIPDGMTVDHLCRVRHCVNPEHLRVLTPSENYSDNSWKRRTRCPLGHPYDDVNTYVAPNGSRKCRICRAESRRRYRSKARVTRLASN